MFHRLVAQVRMGFNFMPRFIIPFTGIEGPNRGEYRQTILLQPFLQMISQIFEIPFPACGLVWSISKDISECALPVHCAPPTFSIRVRLGGACLWPIAFLKMGLLICSRVINQPRLNSKMFGEIQKKITTQFQGTAMVDLFF